MKKLLAIILATVMAFSFVACGEKNTPEEEIKRLERQLVQQKEQTKEAKEKLDKLNDGIAKYEKAKNKVKNIGG